MSVLGENLSQAANPKIRVSAALSVPMVRTFTESDPPMISRTNWLALALGPLPRSSRCELASISARLDVRFGSKADTRLRAPRPVWLTEFTFGSERPPSSADVSGNEGAFAYSLRYELSTKTANYRQFPRPLCKSIAKVRIHLAPPLSLKSLTLK